MSLLKFHRHHVFQSPFNSILFLRLNLLKCLNFMTYYIPSQTEAILKPYLHVEFQIAFPV
ncbi:unnamed protein product [Paramecium octaurelia]|uniref:Uncharacterized protein n=1 Tax=Paramecium octaurelia TaxID=43137 RepID=A0A8S1YD08_PAROT|nr:unnamed protein product [Paramecium octaurelia]